MSKRLLFITPIFPKNSDEDNVVSFIRQFTEEFYENTKVSIDVISLMYPFSSNKYSIGNITIHPIGSHFKSILRQIPFLIRAVLKGKSLYKENPYDGILCFWYRESALVGKILSLLLKVKLTVWMQGQDVRKDNKYISLLRIPANQIVMMSLQQSNFFYVNHNIRIQKIANVAVKRKLFPPFNSGERPYAILGVGNLGALKNYSLFIDIIAELKAKNLHAIIIGEGEELAILKEKIKLLGLTDSIHFLGRLPHATVLNYMNQSKIFLHTSKFEGGGAVIQEALYSGCKVVSTISIDQPIDEENFYFNTEKKALVEQIDSLLEKPLNHKRIEYFKMEDTVETIYRMFYNE